MPARSSIHMYASSGKVTHLMYSGYDMVGYPQQTTIFGTFAGISSAICRDSSCVVSVSESKTIRTPDFSHATVFT